MGSRANGVLVMLAGSIIVLVGFEMYRSPHLDWETFTKTLQNAISWERLTLIFQAVIAQINRFIEDPFSFLGFIVFIIGIGIVLKGLKTMFFGE